jgi:hypothetical protein
MVREFACLLALPVALSLVSTTAGGAARKPQRTLSGVIYFTNNTPSDVEEFPVELYARDQKRRIASTKPNDKHRFALTGVKPGKYLLKLTWPNHCVLWYRVDLTKESMTNARVIMDAACAHANGAIQDFPEN